jgi:hypothetical protein
MQWVRVQKHGLVSRKEKDSRSVVFCISKGYEAAEVALRGRLTYFAFIYGIKTQSLQKRKARFGIM